MALHRTIFSPRPTKVGKQIIKLARAAQAALILLICDLEKNGPATGGGWKNYGKLKGMPGDKRHCHLSKGRRTIGKELARRIADIFGLDYRIFL